MILCPSSSILFYLCTLTEHAGCRGKHGGSALSFLRSAFYENTHKKGNFSTYCLFKSHRQWGLKTRVYYPLLKHRPATFQKAYLSNSVMKEWKGSYVHIQSPLPYFKVISHCSSAWPLFLVEWYILRTLKGALPMLSTAPMAFSLLSVRPR